MPRFSMDFIPDDCESLYRFSRKNGTKGEKILAFLKGPYGEDLNQKLGPINVGLDRLGHRALYVTPKQQKILREECPYIYAEPLREGEHMLVWWARVFGMAPDRFETFFIDRQYFDQENRKIYFARTGRGITVVPTEAQIACLWRQVAFQRRTSFWYQYD